MKFTEHALEMFHRLFSDKQAVDVKRFDGSGARYIDETLIRGPLRGMIRYIEQSPKKPSIYGDLARDGHKIMWVCTINSEGRMSFTGWGVVNGEYTTDIWDSCASIANQDEEPSSSE